MSLFLRCTYEAKTWVAFESDPERETHKTRGLREYILQVCSGPCIDHTRVETYYKIVLSQHEGPGPKKSTNLVIHKSTSLAVASYE